MDLYLHNTETGQVAKAPVQGDGETLWVKPSDVPPWASCVSANLALHLSVTEYQDCHLFEGVYYLIRPERPQPASIYLRF